MTTPTLNIDPTSGRFSTENIGGASGTLLGANVLQQSLDTLTISINNLVGKIGSLSFNGAPASNAQAGQGGGTTKIFPNVINPFSNNANQSGIGGGGAGGAGNVSPPSPFGAGGNVRQTSAIGAFLGAFSGYGQQQLPIQLALNAYATQTALAQGQVSNNFTLQYKQAFGYQGQRLNFMASSPLDAIAGTQGLQYLAGNPTFMGTPIGRAGFGFAAAFANANPLASMQSSVSFAQQITNPQTSLLMMSLGYPVTARRLGGGANLPANVIQGMLRAWYGQKDVNPSTLTAGLGLGGKANLNLQALGINPQTAAPLFEEYNQLFRSGISPSEAQMLINQSKSGNLSTARAAQARLSSLGVKTATSSAQALRNNQAVLTGRDANIASGFARGLEQASGALSQFNNALSSLLTTLHLNGAIGWGGGFLGTLAGTNSGNSLLGLGGGLGLLFGLSRLIGGAAGGGGGLGLGSLGLGGAAAGAGSIAAPALSVLAPLAGGVGLAMYLNRFNTPNPMSRFADWAQSHNIPFGPRSVISTQDMAKYRQEYQQWLRTHQASTGGGAASVATSKQSLPASSTTSGGSVSANAAKAVGAAESQLGVPYIFGDEKPGVGFDCSGLTQWAYSQAGIKLPRTAAQQWSSLQKRSVALNQVQEGDLVFMAGADGSFNAPGHVGLMVSRNQLIQAPFPGRDVSLMAYNPKEWQHAARPSGNGIFGLAGAPVTGNGGVGTNPSTSVGDMGMSIASNYGSSEEVQNVAAALGNILSGGVPASSTTTSGGTKGTGAGSTVVASSPSVARAIAVGKQLASGFGWGSGREWTSLLALWNGESGWRWNATNSTSGAYGIPQSLPASKMASAGPDWKTNAATQIRWGLGYIKGAYGDPATAYSKWLGRSPHWYGGGGPFDGGISIVGDRGPEAIVGGRGTVIDNANTMRLLKAASSQPAQTPWTNLQDMNRGVTNANSDRHVHLHFSRDAVVIRVDHAGNDAASSGRNIARQFMKWLEDENMYDNIGIGSKNG